MENNNENLNTVEEINAPEETFEYNTEVVSEENNVQHESPVVEEPKHEDAVVQEVVTTPSYNAPEEQQLLAPVADGVIGATTAPKPVVEKKTKAEKENEETVAIRSTKNVTWAEVGKVYTGINIVTKSEAEKWLTRSHITVATPEEVAKEFGK